MTAAEFEKMMNWAVIHECVDNSELHRIQEADGSDLMPSNGQIVAWCGSETACCCEGADVGNMSLWIACRNLNRHPLRLRFVARPTRGLAWFNVGSEWTGDFPVRALTLAGPGIDTVPKPEPVFAASHGESEYEVFEIEGGIEPCLRMIGDTYGRPNPFIMNVRLDLKHARRLCQEV